MVSVTARACGLSRSPSQSAQCMHLHVLFELPQLHLALRVAVLVEQLGNDALELAAVLVARRAAAPGVRDVLVARAPQPEVLQLRVELVPGRVEHRALGQVVLVLDRVGHALIDVPPPAAQSFHGPINSKQPSLNDSLPSGTSSAGSKLYSSPSPSQSVHMPCGLLKLNSCGLGGSKLRPQCVQA